MRYAVLTMAFAALVASSASAQSTDPSKLKVN